MKPTTISMIELPGSREVEGGFHLYKLKADQRQVVRLNSFPKDTGQPHQHDFYELFLFREAGGKHEIDFRTFPLHGSSLHLISPGRVHRLVPEHCEGYLLAFTESFLGFHGGKEQSLYNLPLFADRPEKPIVELTGNEFQYLERLLDNLVEDFTGMQKPEESGIPLWLNLRLLLEKACRWYDSKASSPGKVRKTRDLFREFSRLVNKEYKQLSQVQDYAEHLSISPSHLNRVSKTHSGQNAGELIMQRRLLEAQRLLVFSNMPAKEIAFSLHFSDPSYFSRIFRRKAGKSPSAFRSVMREKYHS